MFVVLDTNHVTEIIRESDIGGKLSRRLLESDAEVFVTIVSAQEVFEGWLAVINRHPAGPDQVKGYRQFRLSIDTLNKFSVLDFDHEAANAFMALKKALPRVGTMDLKIAAICIAHDGLLLSRNHVDFHKVPDLRVENWLD